MSAQHSSVAMNQVQLNDVFLNGRLSIPDGQVTTPMRTVNASLEETAAVDSLNPLPVSSPLLTLDIDNNVDLVRFRNKADCVQSFRVTACVEVRDPNTSPYSFAVLTEEFLLNTIFHEDGSTTTVKSEASLTAMAVNEDIEGLSAVWTVTDGTAGESEFLLGCQPFLNTSPDDIKIRITIQQLNGGAAPQVFWIR